MGEFSKWLLHEDQKEFFNYLFAIVLNAVFLAITGVLLWSLGWTSVVFRLAKGYWYFWTVLIVTASLMVLAQRIFRMDLYSHYNAYVISGLVVSGVLQVGWSAFAALVIDNAVAGAAIWKVIIIYGVGIFSSYVACVIVSVFYMGAIYRMVNLILAILSFIVFSVWPGVGRAIYGWFFDLF